jgi:surface antigen
MVKNVRGYMMVGGVKWLLCDANDDSFSNYWVQDSQISAAAPSNGNFNVDSLWYKSPFNSFPRLQCTWFCKGRVGEALRINFIVSGNAAQWFTNSSTANRVDASGVTTGQSVTVHKETNGNNPRAGSVAVFNFWVGPPNVSPGDYYGHVIYIEKVENGTVYFSHSSGSKGPRTGSATISSFISMYNDQPAQYINGVKQPVFRGYLYF